MHGPSDVEMNLGKARNYGNCSPLVYIGSFGRTYIGQERTVTFSLCSKKESSLAREARGVLH